LRTNVFAEVPLPALAETKPVQASFI
jgi:hypothetical protein